MRQRVGFATRRPCTGTPTWSSCFVSPESAAENALVEGPRRPPRIDGDRGPQCRPRPRSTTRRCDGHKRTASHVKGDLAFTQSRNHCAPARYRRCHLVAGKIGLEQERTTEMSMTTWPAPPRPDARRQSGDARHVPSACRTAWPRPIHPRLYDDGRYADRPWRRRRHRSANGAPAIQHVVEKADTGRIVDCRFRRDRPRSRRRFPGTSQRRLAHSAPFMSSAWPASFFDRPDLRHCGTAGLAKAGT